MLLLDWCVVFVVVREWGGDVPEGAYCVCVERNELFELHALHAEGLDEGGEYTLCWLVLSLLDGSCGCYLIGFNCAPATCVGHG